MSRRSDHISESRRALTRAILALQELEALEKERASFERRGEPLTNEDFIGENSAISATQFGQAMTVADTIIAGMTDQARDALYPVRL